MLQYTTVYLFGYICIKYQNNFENTILIIVFVLDIITKMKCVSY